MLRTPYSVRTKPHSAGLQISGVREEFARHRGLGAALLASLAPARLWTNRNCSFQLNKKGQRRCPIGGWGTIQGPRAACAGSWPSNHAEAAQFFPEQAIRGCSCRAAELQRGLPPLQALQAVQALTQEQATAQMALISFCGASFHCCQVPGPMKSRGEGALPR